jgi:hypothetical protein
MDEIKKFDLSNRLYYLILAAVAGVLLYSAISVGFWFFDDGVDQTFSVTGEGKTYVKPDVAITNLGVTSEGAESSDVVNKNNEKMNAIIKAVKDLGIDDKDIQTSMYNLSPKYNYTRENGSYLDGYTLNQQITVKIRDFDKISSVLDVATQNGANQVGNLQITVDDQETYKAEARQKAIESAKEKAKEMAKESGIKLGKIVDISESYDGYVPYPMNDMVFESSVAKGGASVAPQIETGQEEITVTVYLTYKIK